MMDKLERMMDELERTHGWVTPSRELSIQFRRFTALVPTSVHITVEQASVLYDALEREVGRCD